MNKMFQGVEEAEVYKRYHVPSMPNYAHRPKNALFISRANSVLHEGGKFLAAYMVRKWGDVKITPSMVLLLQQLDAEVSLVMKDFPKESANYVSECVPNSEPDKRVDVLKLFGEVKYELETDRRRAARFKGSDSVVIPLWIEK